PRCPAAASRRPADRVSSAKYPAAGRASSSLDCHPESIAATACRAWSCRFLLEIGCLRRGYQVLLSQGLQHLFIALAAADFLPAPPVESGFVAVDSGHVYLLPCGLS